MKSELHYWLALIRTPGIGSALGKKLLQKFPTITDLFKTKTSTLINLGIPEAIAYGLKTPTWNLIAKDIEWLSQPNNYLITVENNHYPFLLKQIPNAPLALFVTGNVDILNTQQIAIVGSRQPSYTGLEHAYRFAYQLAALNITIISGLATGIDTESHKGALAVQGKTIAVLGTGIDISYPPNNKKLKQQILELNGAIISEFPLGIEAKAENFPRRNRIISGLSLGVLVIEATAHSGSLITARLACEQGREVFAIPSSINNPLAKGCHLLIKQGAKLVENIYDILEELPTLIVTTKASTPPTSKQQNQSQTKETLDNDQQKLLEYIGYDPTPMDILIERSGLSAQNISSKLLLLELQGYIKAVYGGYIKLKNN